LKHDNSSEDEYESGDQGSESDDLLANKLAEQILHEKLKERGINIPNNYMAEGDLSPKPLYGNRKSHSVRPACKLQIIQARGLTDFLPGLFSDSSSLAAAAVGAAFLITTFINHKSGSQTNSWQAY